jgi:phage terminase large subunit GpA-like protein
MSKNSIKLVKGFLDGLRPVPPLTVTQWADTYRKLPSESSAEPGQYRSSRTPYLREIMDCLSTRSPVQVLVNMKSAQIGGTEAANNWIGYTIDVAPAPFLLVMPTDDLIKRNTAQKLDPMFKETPQLRNKIVNAGDREGKNNGMMKTFPGGILVMAAAQSPTGLRSMSAQNVILDEVDNYKMDVGGEGSPIELAKTRTRTFPRRKIFVVSTPTISGASIIEQEYNLTDQRKYFVPCPDCGHKQALVFEQLRWTEGDADSVCYCCEACGVLIEEHKKTQLLAKGEWIPTAPEKISRIRRGYHLNALYSPYGWYSWADIVRQYEEAIEEIRKEGKNDKLKTFTNTILGLPWEEKGDRPQWDRLYERREQYQRNVLPKEVCFMTCGVDIQADRIELEIVGWGKGKRSWSIDYRVITGDTGQTPVWRKLEQLMSEDFRTEDGATMQIGLFAIDTGFNTQKVYEFCRKFEGSRVLAVKGQGNDKMNVPISNAKIVDVNEDGKKVGTVALWNVGVGVIKSEIYGWLRQNLNEDGSEPAGYCHFPQYDVHYFKSLTAEVYTYKIVNNVRKYYWVKMYDRNEVLDCRVYARAASIVGQIDRFTDEDFEVVRAQSIRIDVEEEAPKKRKSNFW